MLQFPAKLFDLFGLIVPIIIPVRLLLQDLCRRVTPCQSRFCNFGLFRKF